MKKLLLFLFLLSLTLLILWQIQVYRANSGDYKTYILYGNFSFARAALYVTLDIFAFLFLFWLSKIHVLTKLSYIPPSYFGLIYIALIFLYAFIYCLMPNNFYQSTYNLEIYKKGSPANTAVAYELQNEIVTLLSNRYNARKSNFYLINVKGDTIQNPFFYTDEMYVYADNDTIHFIIGIPNIVQTNSFRHLPLKFRVNEVNPRELVVDEKENIDTINLGYNFWNLFPSPYTDDELSGNQSIGYIEIDENLQRKINSFSYGLNGQLTIDDFGRMFYFSAVTITTLGYGDITPITSWGRLAVSTEAILGVVLIGLFLNALAAGINRKTKQ